jgi:hypothetical protein
MAVLCEVFQREFKPEVAAIYFDDLRDYSIEEVERAAHTLRRRCEFMPKIAEFMNELIPPASVAWSRAQKIVRKHSAYTLRFAGPDRAIGHTLEAIGGMDMVNETLKNGDMKTVSVLAARFEKAYDHISRQILTDIVLTGWGAAIYPGEQYRKEISTSEAVPLAVAGNGGMRLIQGGGTDKD